MNTQFTPGTLLFHKGNHEFQDYLFIFEKYSNDSVKGTDLRIGVVANTNV